MLETWMDSDSDAPTVALGPGPVPGAVPADLALGQRVGRYVVLDKVGAGGMG